MFKKSLNLKKNYLAISILAVLVAMTCWSSVCIFCLYFLFYLFWEIPYFTFHFTDAIFRSVHPIFQTLHFFFLISEILFFP